MGDVGSCRCSEEREKARVCRVLDVAVEATGEIELAASDSENGEIRPDERIASEVVTRPNRTESVAVAQRGVGDEQEAAKPDFPTTPVYVFVR